MGNLCETPGCSRTDLHARGYCPACYQRMRQTVPGWGRRRGVDECSVEGCERLVQSRAMCNMHYQRWRTKGETGPGAPARIHGTEAERFWPKVDKAGECWLWTGSIDADGYGRFNGSKPHAHRMAYVLTHGAIPDGMALHHICGVARCVNPDHLEPVTTGENTIESLRVKALEAENARLRRRLADLVTAHA